MGMLIKIVIFNRMVVGSKGVYSRVVFRIAFGVWEFRMSIRELSKYRFFVFVSSFVFFIDYLGYFFVVVVFSFLLVLWLLCLLYLLL